MSNEQVRELLDMVMALPQTDNFLMKFEYNSEDRDVSIFIHGKKRCEGCGRLEDKTEFKISDKYDIIKEFINRWKEIIEKENENE